MTETQQTIAAYRAEQQRRQHTEDLIVTALITAIAAPVFAAIAYALIK